MTQVEIQAGEQEARKLMQVYGLEWFAPKNGRYFIDQNSLCRSIN
jgi:hypothetical protein